jgi:hypothetical protein
MHGLATYCDGAAHDMNERLQTVLPKVLYKYCDGRGVDILRNLRLRVTQFDRFNDPFEITPRMRQDFPIEEARAALTNPQNLRDLYEHGVREGSITYSFEEYKALTIAVREPFAAKIVEDYPADAKQFREEHMPTIGREFGLICLSAVPNDILMWAHYTDGHRGLVVGFDTNNEFFRFPPVHEVNYSSERVLLGHWFDLRDALRRAEMVRSLIRTKSQHWRYELEWRQLRELAKCIPQEDSQVCRPTRTNYYVPIAASAVAEVIVGCRCKDGEIASLLNAPELAHVKRHRACIHDTDFALNVIDD